MLQEKITFRKLRDATLAATFAVTATSVSQAACYAQKAPFSPPLGENVSKIMETYGACRISYNPFDDEALISVTVAAARRHAKLSRARPTVFMFTPRAGFYAADSFAIRVCAQQPGRTGCGIVSDAVVVTPMPRPH